MGGLSLSIPHITIHMSRVIRSSACFSSPLILLLGDWWHLLKAVCLYLILARSRTRNPAPAKTSYPIDSHVGTAYALTPTSALHERSDLCRDETLIVCNQ